MSQQTSFDPSLDLSESYLDAQSSRPFTDATLELWMNGPFAQWNGPGSSKVYSAPSPWQSLRTARSAPASRTVANPRNVDRHALHQQRSNVGGRAGIDYLQVPLQSSARTSTNSADPMSRFLFANDAPFTTERIGSGNVATSYASFPQRNTGITTYSDTSGSAFRNPAPASDSAYQTLTSQSIVSQEPEGLDQELPPDIYQLENMQVASAPSESVDMLNAYGEPSIADHASQYSGRSLGRRSAKPIMCQEPDCGRVCKNNSDYKKHMSRHQKPFRCREPNCRRKQGFTTQNDLDRHQKSVHGINQTKNSWKCAAKNCRHPDKIWPRLDNFKQHVARMHAGEDLKDIIARSAYQHGGMSPDEDSVSVTPMDTTLAGIGTEIGLSRTSNEADDSTIPCIILTPDQETSNQWMDDPSNFVFPMDTGPSAFTSEKSGYNFSEEQGTRSPARIDGGSASTQQDTDCCGLNALAAAATSQSPHAKVAKRQPRLPKAPQIKAEQQKQNLLQRLTKTIADNIQDASNQGNALESIIERALVASIGQTPAPSRLRDMLSVLGSHGQSQEDTKDAETRSFGGASRHRSRQTSSASMSLNCDRCDAVVPRPCDMRKHMKRHTRPYGCTHTSCKKTFGAKADWKRHENSQHFILEAFRCCLSPLGHSRSNQEECGELFHRRALFEGHLKDEHLVNEPQERAKQVKNSRIGKNGQGQFWCGFCEKIIPLKKTRNDAWDERFDHIDDHFCKEDKRIEDWWCLDANRRKGDVLKDMDRDAWEEDTDEGSSGGDGQGGGVGGKRVHEVVSEAGKKRRGEDEAAERAHKRTKHEMVTICCVCSDGPGLPHTVSSCVKCNHDWCNDCIIMSMD